MEAIVAADLGWGIGYQGRLLCPIRADLRRFRQLTLGKTVILGRKTLETFPGGRPLPERVNLILSRDLSLAVPGGQVFHGLDSLLAAAPKDSVVIGGESVYRALLPRCDRVHLTRILRRFPADAYFPVLSPENGWSLAEEEPVLEENGVEFQYLTYQRREGGEGL